MHAGGLELPKLTKQNTSSLRNRVKRTRALAKRMKGKDTRLEKEAGILPKEKKATDKQNEGKPALDYEEETLNTPPPGAEKEGGKQQQENNNTPQDVWKVRTDPATSKKYEINERTGETRWVAERTKHRDPATGRDFLYNLSTKSTRWM